MAVARQTGTQLEALEQQRAQVKQNKEHRKILAGVKKHLAQEAKLFAQVLISEWYRLGEYYAFRWRNVDGGRRRKRIKRQLVKFERIVTTPEAIWYKILVGRRGMFGYRSEIPHKVRVADLVSDDTLFELSAACHRPVTAVIAHKEVRRNDEDDAALTRGVWVCVHRNGSVSAIPRLVTHKETLQHHPEDTAEKGAIVLGIGEHRQVHLVDLESYPHMLVAGASGGGKSNMLNNILCTLIRFHSAEDLKIVLIDPKRLELSYYRQAPHLLGDIIFEPDAAIATLERMIEEVLARTQQLEGRSRKFSEFNRKYPDERLPRILIVVEEMAALMRDRKEAKYVQERLNTLASLGRAVGVHLLLCTQLPVADIVPSTIKVSMWVRIAGRVQNHVESSVILSSPRAAKLPARPGRMVYGKDSFIFEIQTPLTTDDDIAYTIKVAKGRHLGWVKLDGWLPVINTDALVYALCKNPVFRRQLSFKRIVAEMSRFGISARQCRAFCEDLIAAQSWTIDGEQYTLRPLGEVYEIVPANEAAADAVRRDEAEQAAAQAPRSQGFVVDAPRLPLPLLQLPAPREPWPPKDTGSVVELFLERHCIIERQARVTFRHLYAAYCAFCADLGVPELPEGKFGGLMKRRFQPVRIHGARGLAGIRLTETSQTTQTSSVKEPHHHE